MCAANVERIAALENELQGAREANDGDLSARLRQLEKQNKTLGKERDDSLAELTTLQVQYCSTWLDWLCDGVLVFSCCSGVCERTGYANDEDEDEDKDEEIEQKLSCAVRAQERVRAQAKEVKEANEQRKAAQEELVDMQDTLTEQRNAKAKLAKETREREQELEDLRNRSESMKLDIKRIEKSKRDVRFALCTLHSCCLHAFSSSSTSRPLREPHMALFKTHAIDLHSDQTYFRSRRVQRC